MANNKLAKTKPTSDLFTFNDDQVELIKNTVAKDATDDELKMFLYQAQRTGLDPLARQIYFTKRGGKVTIQTSIDGLRVVAERSNGYSGQDEPKFVEKEGLNHPISCTLTVYKLDAINNRVPITATVYWDEYKPASGQDFMWNKMPHTMLSKVCESICLRKAFPQDLSGIYSSEEMEQSQPDLPTNPPEPVRPVIVAPHPKQDLADAIHMSGNPEPLPWEGEQEKIEDDGEAPLTPRQMADKIDPEWITGKPVVDTSALVPTKEEVDDVLDPATDQQRKMFFAIAAELGYESEVIKERVKKLFELESFTQITKSEISEAIDKLNERVEQRKLQEAEKERQAKVAQADNAPASSQMKMQIATGISRGEIDFDHAKVMDLTMKEARKLLAIL